MRTSTVQVADPADAAEGLLLEDAEQLGLEVRPHVADLVQEDGATVRLLEEPLLQSPCVGEGALLVAEELALQEMLGQGHAVHGLERAPAPGRSRNGSPGPPGPSRCRFLPARGRWSHRCRAICRIVALRLSTARLTPTRSSSADPCEASACSRVTSRRNDRVSRAFRMARLSSSGSNGLDEVVVGPELHGPHRRTPPPHAP